jgi:hypothetical protein
MRLTSLAIILSFLLTSCSTVIITKRDDPAVASFLTELDEKVTGYMYGKEIPDNFDAAQYKEAVAKVCDNPACKKQSDALFHDYDVNAKKVDGFFSVLLCDKDTHDKVMEDYSCNNVKVEIRSWEMQKPVACGFAADWKEIHDRECR